MNSEILSKALDLLENTTPLKTDCGALCDAACCKPGSGESGVWLLPCEDESLMTWGTVSASRFPVAGTPVRLLMCEKICNRETRPFMCRIFPLSPFFSKKREVWDVRMDRRAAEMCPLYGYGIKALNPEFVKNAKEAVRLLAADKEWENVLRILADEEAAYRIEL